MLDRVTLTGADNYVNYSDMVALTQEFPFVEWGILFHKKKHGGLRYPTKDWVEGLVNYDLNLSAHLCGEIVQSILEGEWAEHLHYLLFKRIQINIYRYEISSRKNFVLGTTRAVFRCSIYKTTQIIVQLANPDDALLEMFATAGIDAAALFDSSGGQGVLRPEWPRNGEQYAGYAGGLNVDNLSKQLPIIASKTKGKFWIDLETGLRTEDHFDMDKARKVLQIAKEFRDGTS